MDIGPVIGPIGIAGAGNVASYIAQCLVRQGEQVSGIWDRTPEHGKMLAKNCACVYFAEIEALARQSSILILAVSDGALPEIIHALEAYDGLLLHTAGAVPIEVFGSRQGHSGVLYPYMTLHRQAGTPAPGPFFWLIEGSNTHALTTISQLAEKLGWDYRTMNSRQRLIYHTAAIFANNFSNLMFRYASDVLQQHRLSPDILLPIIRQTAMNAASADPADLQTGPARRGDTATIDLHRGVLRDNPKLLEVYNLLTARIEGLYHENP